MEGGLGPYASRRVQWMGRSEIGTYWPVKVKIKVRRGTV